jgi:hypothetical protein
MSTMDDQTFLTRRVRTLPSMAELVRIRANPTELFCVVVVLYILRCSTVLPCGILQR